MGSERSWTYTEVYVDLNYSSHKALGRTIPNEPGPKGTDLASVHVLGAHRPRGLCADEHNISKQLMFMYLCACARERGNECEKERHSATSKVTAEGVSKAKEGRVIHVKHCQSKTQSVRKSWNRLNINKSFWRQKKKKILQIDQRSRMKGCQEVGRWNLIPLMRSKVGPDQRSCFPQLCGLMEVFMLGIWEWPLT